MRIGVLGAAGPLMALAALPASAAPTKSDAALLHRAVASLENSRTFMVVSDVVTASTKQKVGGTLRTRAYFARDAGGRFHCDITIGASHDPAKVLYQTVGDGRRVWTYAVQVRQYTVAPEASYCRSVNLGLHCVKLGLLGALLAGSDTPGQDTLRDVAALAAQRGESDAPVLLGGRPLRVVFLNLGGDGTLRLLLDPRTATLRQLTFTGSGPQAHFAVKETVVRQTLNAPMNPALFRFTPPPGVRPLPPPATDFLP